MYVFKPLEKLVRYKHMFIIVIRKIKKKDTYFPADTRYCTCIIKKNVRRSTNLLKRNTVTIICNNY